MLVMETQTQKVALAAAGVLAAAALVNNVINAGAAGYKEPEATQKDPVWPALVDYVCNVVGFITIPIWGASAVSYRVGQWVGGKKAAAAVAAAPTPESLVPVPS